MDTDSRIQRLLAQAVDFSVERLPRAWGGPAGQGRVRSRPEDFFVDEILGFEPSGEGEHLFLHIEKRGLNTMDVADRLRRVADVRQVDVSFAGLKDRHAVTRQWFSIHLPGREAPLFDAIVGDNLQLLAQARHDRKLRRGALRGNRFRLVVRGFTGDVDRADEVLAAIRSTGFPNYFGSQRFGRENNNLVRAAELFTGRRRMRRAQKGIYLSAVRSLLFNQVLAARVTEENWSQPTAGDVFQIAGSNSLFTEPAIDDTLTARCQALDIHPTGPLHGRGGRVLPAQHVAQLESEVLEPYADWCNGLEREGLESDRRALRAVAQDLEWSRHDDIWELSFALGRGCYATALLREWLDETSVPAE